MAPERLNELARFYCTALIEDCAKFWFPRSLDRKHGGYLHCLDRDGSVLDTDKSVWAQGRMAWMLATLYNTVERRAEWLEWSRLGLDFLDHHCFDTDGRMFFHVTREGKPIRKRRYAFSESFAAIAHAAYTKATGNAHSAQRAHELFDRFVDWNFTPGKMPPKFTEVRPLIGMGPRMITIVTAQELRANLGDDPKLTRWIDRCIGEIERWFVKPDIQCVMEAVAPDGSIVDHFDGRTLNPGHAIEGAWFILHEGRHRQDSRLIKLGCQMLDWMWARGWDREFGGIFYFRDVFDKPVQEYWHDMKFWWPHDEAIIATLLAYQLTRDPKYAEWHRLVHDWSFEHFGDPQHGEWFGYLHRDGRVSVPLKGNLWKSFFHHPRALWYCARLCEEMNEPT
ncbi:MAG TPA: AGE family epimerase/isomerase [Verrucomicrobiae bacterium]|nr:AGE family epimerase/isomerase [Verrucomicrobiae bacterium]